MDINFAFYDKKYCELSWKWLNDSEIKILTMTPDFTKESQNSWFLSLKQRNDYLIWGIECDKKPIGNLGLKNINYDSKSAEYFGYIGEKEYWSKGIGKFMMEFILNKAGEKDFNKIHLKVLKSNNRAISLYLKYGFQVCDETTDYLIMIREESVNNV